MTSNISEHMKKTSEIVDEEFEDSGTYAGYINGKAQCLPCKPGVYAITCDKNINFDDSLVTKENIRIRNHIGNILYIGSSESLNYRISQLINDKGHVASPKFNIFDQDELNKIHIKYKECEDKDDALDYEQYLISMYGSENYENIEDYLEEYEYPPFNSKI